jgi:hypothetical protein
MLPVDVRIGSGLARLIACPRHRQLRLVDQDEDVPRVAIADRLALAGA